MHDFMTCLQNIIPANKKRSITTNPPQKNLLLTEIIYSIWIGLGYTCKAMNKESTMQSKLEKLINFLFDKYKPNFNRDEQDDACLAFNAITDSLLEELEEEFPQPTDKTLDYIYIKEKTLIKCCGCNWESKNITSTPRIVLNIRLLHGKQIDVSDLIVEYFTRRIRSL